jgi:hypothetical protein
VEEKDLKASQVAVLLSWVIAFSIGFILVVFYENELGLALLFYAFGVVVTYGVFKDG